MGDTKTNPEDFPEVPRQLGPPLRTPSQVSQLLETPLEDLLEQQYPGVIPQSWSEARLLEDGVTRTINKGQNNQDTSKLAKRTIYAALTFQSKVKVDESDLEGALIDPKDSDSMTEASLHEPQVLLAMAKFLVSSDYFANHKLKGARKATFDRKVSQTAEELKAQPTELLANTWDVAMYNAKSRADIWDKIVRTGEKDSRVVRAMGRLLARSRD